MSFSVWIYLAPNDDVIRSVGWVSRLIESDVKPTFRVDDGVSDEPFWHRIDTYECGMD